MNWNDDDSSIRVLVVDDSVVMRSVLARMLKGTPRIQICGFAKDGVEAVEKAKQLEPDVITLDIEMPVLDGIAALKQIMRARPCPIIMVSSMTNHGAQITLDALSAGAFDYIPKEELCRATTSLNIKHVLLDRIEAAARSPLSAGRHRLSHNTSAAAAQRAPSALGQTQSVPKIIAIGASTGGPKALEDILTALPGDLPVPVVVVQHMPPGFTAPFAKRLDGLCEVRVHEARQGEFLEFGTVYIAPAGKHLAVFTSTHSAPCLCISDFPSDTLHKPSVDVTMLSVAHVFGCHALGLILTGMGNDGLRGMTAIHDSGGITIGQDEATSAVYGMPRACAEHGVLQKVLPLRFIADEVRAQFSVHV
jgi:two-component system chemotaxis response regulator CheB